MPAGSSTYGPCDNAPQAKGGRGGQGGAMQRRVVVVGAGMGGLVAACLLARAGAAVTLLEAADGVGGKARAVAVAGRRLDVGPSVLTLRHVFDHVFADCGERLDDHLVVRALPQLARHVFAPTPKGRTRATVLDLYPDVEASRDAVGTCFGAAAARAYAAYAAYAERLYASAEGTFIYGEKPGVLGALRAFGRRALLAPWEMDARRTMWRALQAAFPSCPELVRLYARYATYCGASPFAAPATLNLVSHVERLGVWGIEGGISALAAALADLARRQGVQVRLGAQVARLQWGSAGRVRGVQLMDGEEVPAAAVVLAGALRPDAPNGALWPALAPGPERAAGARAPTKAQPGLSADVAGLVARVGGEVAPAQHTVVFGADSREEFAALFDRRQRPVAPTVYLCAPERGPGAGASGAGAGVAETGAGTGANGEPVFVLTNAPPERTPRTPAAQAAWLEATCDRLAAAGVHLVPTGTPHLEGPASFARRFPGTDGVLYGPPPHSWRSFLARPGSRTRWPGVYAAGGLTHPGPGVPMAALSGRQAARAVLRDAPELARG